MSIIENEHKTKPKNKQLRQFKPLEKKYYYQIINRLYRWHNTDTKRLR